MNEIIFEPTFWCMNYHDGGGIRLTGSQAIGTPANRGGVARPPLPVPGTVLAASGNCWARRRKFIVLPAQEGERATEAQLALIDPPTGALAQPDGRDASIPDPVGSQIPAHVEICWSGRWGGPR